MKHFKQEYLTIGFAFILLLIVLGLLSISIFRNEQTSNSSSDNITVIPSSTQTTANPPVIYKKVQEDKMMDYITNRRQLADNDRIAKATILTILPINKDSGIVYESSTIRIEYNQAPDLFQVEIMTTDIQKAKNEANTWLRTKGLSQEAICKLPVTFFLNYDVAQQLRRANVEFDPLSNGC